MYSIIWYLLLNNYSTTTNATLAIPSHFYLPLKTMLLSPMLIKNPVYVVVTS